MGNNYVYDAWGNLYQKNVTKCSAENLGVTVAANNWISTAGYTYDPAGNMTHDATSGLSYSFDQENRITGANGYTYTYDADGNRVQKANGTSGTLYWYMTPGIVAESDLSGVTKSEYVFFDGERVARRDFPAGSVAYYFSDHLKTASVVTDSAGTIKSESDFYPWGGELQFVANDSNHYKFTGKERDSETGLDYFGARYYSNGLGRWISADWSATPVPVPYADFADPQSLNLYTYVRNMPATRYDVDGHFSLPVPPPKTSPCDLPKKDQKADDSKRNNSNRSNENNSNQSNSSNARSGGQEQGRDAKGRFLPKKPGQAKPGAGAEKKALDAVGATKNTKPLSNGRIPDGNMPDESPAQKVEVKSGATVSNTEQLREMGEGAVADTGKPLKVLTTDPNVKVSKPALDNKNLEFEHKPQE